MPVVGITLEHYLKGLDAICSQCGGQMHIYPCPAPQGVGYCPACSPAWIKDFAEWATENRVGIKIIEKR